MMYFPVKSKCYCSVPSNMHGCSRSSWPEPRKHQGCAVGTKASPASFCATSFWKAKQGPGQAGEFFRARTESRKAKCKASKGQRPTPVGDRGSLWQAFPCYRPTLPWAQTSTLQAEVPQCPCQLASRATSGRWDMEDLPKERKRWERGRGTSSFLPSHCQRHFESRLTLYPQGARGPAV